MDEINRFNNFKSIEILTIKKALATHTNKKGVTLLEVHTANKLLEELAKSNANFEEILKQ
jgi:hypothetical protein